MKNGRGFTIGGYPSQPIGNYAPSEIDHYMKEVVKVKAYIRYCDDTVGLARTKAEAIRQVEAFIEESDRMGLVVKANYVVAPIAHEGKKKKRRWRQRGPRKRD